MFCHKLTYIAHYLNLLMMREELSATSFFIIDGLDFHGFFGRVSSCVVDGLHFHGFVGKCQQKKTRRVQQMVVNKIRFHIKELV